MSLKYQKQQTVSTAIVEDVGSSCAVWKQSPTRDSLDVETNYSLVRVIHKMYSFAAETDLCFPQNLILGSLAPPSQLSAWKVALRRQTILHEGIREAHTVLPLRCSVEKSHSVRTVSHKSTETDNFTKQIHHTIFCCELAKFLSETFAAGLGISKGEGNPRFQLAFTTRNCWYGECSWQESHRKRSGENFPWRRWHLYELVRKEARECAFCHSPDVLVQHLRWPGSWFCFTMLRSFPLLNTQTIHEQSNRNFELSFVFSLILVFQPELDACMVEDFKHLKVAQSCTESMAAGKASSLPIE